MRKLLCTMNLHCYHSNCWVRIRNRILFNFLYEFFSYYFPTIFHEQCNHVLLWKNKCKTMRVICLGSIQFTLQKNNAFTFIKLTLASVSSGSNSVSLFRLRLFTCSSTKLKCSSALKHNLSRNDVTTSWKWKSNRKEKWTNDQIQMIVVNKISI